jgi:hypothetical protein
MILLVLGQFKEAEKIQLMKRSLKQALAWDVRLCQVDIYRVSI